ncbi:MAG: pilus assembly protein PilM [Chitinivibrionia bacterium]|nr:pilus assembly protein PilM [Chitinivibrionia bacterium]
MGLFAKRKRKNYSVGLDIGSKSIKLVEIKKEDDFYRLVAVGVQDLPDGIVSNGEIKEKEIFISTISELINRCDPEIVDVIISMGTSSILSDKIKLNIEGSDDVAETILFEASQRSPFDGGDVTIQYKILPKSLTQEENIEMEEEKGDVTVLLVAAKEKNMKWCIDALYEAGLRPTIVDVSSYAFNNCYALESEVEEFPETLVLMDIGHQGSRMLFIKDGIYHSARNINIGGDYIAKTLQKQLKIDYQRALSILTGQQVQGVSLDDVQASLQFAFEEFVGSFDMAYSYYSKEAGYEKVEKIVVCGGGVYIPGLIDFLSNRLEIQVRLSNPFAFLKYDEELFNNADPSNFAALLSIATGLALRGVGRI